MGIYNVFRKLWSTFSTTKPTDPPPSSSFPSNTSQQKKDNNDIQKFLLKRSHGREKSSGKSSSPTTTKHHKNEKKDTSSPRNTRYRFRGQHQSPWSRFLKHFHQNKCNKSNSPRTSPENIISSIKAPETNQNQRSCRQERYHHLFNLLQHRKYGDKIQPISPQSHISINKSPETPLSIIAATTNKQDNSLKSIQAVVDENVDEIKAHVSIKEEMKLEKDDDDTVEAGDGRDIKTSSSDGLELKKTKLENTSENKARTGMVKTDTIETTSMSATETMLTAFSSVVSTILLVTISELAFESASAMDGGHGNILDSATVSDSSVSTTSSGDVNGGCRVSFEINGDEHDRTERNNGEENGEDEQNGGEIPHHEIEKERSFSSLLYYTRNPRIGDISDSGIVMKRSNVTGDGRCLFRALVRCQNYAAVRAKASSSVSTWFYTSHAPQMLKLKQQQKVQHIVAKMEEKDERRSADELRLRTVEQLHANRELLAEFYVIEGNFLEHATSMACPRSYGGEPELLVLAKHFHQPIAVYIIGDDNKFRRIQLYGKYYHGEPMRLLYTHNIHYDALLPIDVNI